MELSNNFQPFIAPIFTLVTAIVTSLLGRKRRGEGRAVRRIAHHADLRAKFTKDSEAGKLLDALLVEEVKVFQEDVKKNLGKKNLLV